MNSPKSGVSEAFVDTIPETKDTGNDPRTPVTTDYVLTRQQEDDLCQHLELRIADLEKEMGRDEVHGNPAWWGTSAYSYKSDSNLTVERSFLSKRALYHMMAMSQYQWREHMLGGIYEDSNLSLPMLEAILNKSSSKANEALFGTDPWLTAYPIGDVDTEYAKNADKFISFKFRKGHVKQGLKSAVDLAGIQGESVVKVMHKVSDTFYEKTMNVMVDLETGKPLIALDGDYVEADAKTIAIPINDPLTGMPAIDPLTGMPVTQQVLKRDGKTPLPQPGTYATDIRRLPIRKVLLEVPSTEPIFYQDFLCPLNAPDVQTADIAVHLRDMPVARLMDYYQRSVVLAEDETSSSMARDTISRVQSLRTVGTTPINGAGQGKPEFGQGFLSESAKATAPALVNLAECYLHYDANNDGIVESVMVLYDRTNRVPLFYDYVANITPKGERPFAVVRVDPVPDRWWGRGRVEKWESLQAALDLFFNRMVFSSSKNGRVDAVIPDNFENWNADEFDLNDGKVKQLKQNMTLEESIMSKQLSDIKTQELQHFVDIILQFAANGSGVANANDAQQAGLQTAETATGVRSIESSGDVLFGKSLDDLLVGVETAVEMAVHVLFQNMNDEESFAFTEGDKSTTVLLRRDDIDGLDLDIEVLMTKNRGEKQLVAGNQAFAITQAYFALPPQVQMQVAPIVRFLLQTLNIPNVDEIIVPVVMPPMLPDGTPMPMEGDPMMQGDPAAAAPMAEPEQPALGMPANAQQ